MKRRGIVKFGPLNSSLWETFRLFLVHPVSSTRLYMNGSSKSPAYSSEQRTLNYLINQYLFSNNYKLTSVTFAEENESIDLDSWNGMTPENVSLPDLIHLYRWYCYQLHLTAHKPARKDVSVGVNMDASLAEDYLHLQNLFQQIVRVISSLSGSHRWSPSENFSKQIWPNRTNTLSEMKRKGSKCRNKSQS